jgi:two-component system phosphate regulon sensor histidine kinase PhoR
MHTELWRIILAGLFALLIGWSLGYPFEAVLVGVALYMVWTFSTISNLFNWIDKGMRDIPPDADGVWGEISDTLNRQRRRHRRSQSKMRSTIKRVTRVTEALDQGVLVLRSDLTLDWWNSSAKSLLGLRSSDRGSVIVNLIRDPKFVNYIHQQAFDTSIQMRSTLHEGRLLDYSASYFSGEEVVLVITDITRLDNLERLRKEFVGNISHELRTPLTVLRGYVETLKDMPGNTDIADKAFDQMATQVNRMQTLADDLIVLSRFEADSNVSDHSPIELHSLLQEIVAEATQLSNGSHNLRMNCDPSVQLCVEMHGLRSALGNIVFNAVRHNPAGADIEINVEQTAGYVSVRIKDNGVGIDPQEIPYLTERFYRGDSSRNSDTGGSGLGLAIVKHAVARCGGSLYINSRLGQGAEFICRFPLRVE